MIKVLINWTEILRSKVLLTNIVHMPEVILIHLGYGLGGVDAFRMCVAALGSKQLPREEFYRLEKQVTTSRSLHINFKSPIYHRGIVFLSFKLIRYSSICI
ncbi:hypothetical protein IEQ34_022308 [Dendrobium chrysotoxum]|uniref:Uncharacterized protein n=1 Tax=Dendrobium chrysotoxum TaxID=161865 RepID=A0AAV7FYP1_DENCH|nr:hypothetical protein IEQ34_022308 [Dendrobium chrysotoxum]